MTRVHHISDSITTFQESVNKILLKIENDNSVVLDIKYQMSSDTENIYQRHNALIIYTYKT